MATPNPPSSMGELTISTAMMTLEEPEKQLTSPELNTQNVQNESLMDAIVNNLTPDVKSHATQEVDLDLQRAAGVNGKKLCGASSSDSIPGNCMFIPYMTVYNYYSYNLLQLLCWTLKYLRWNSSAWLIFLFATVIIWFLWD